MKDKSKRYYQAKKLYQDHVSVRDYVVKNAIEYGSDLVVKYDGKEMFIPYSNLLQAHSKFHTETFNSKYGQQQVEYTLYDFPWHPKEEDQLHLFEADF